MREAVEPTPASPAEDTSASVAPVAESAGPRASETQAEPNTEAEAEAPTPLPPKDREPADPDIERALDLIATSGLRFVDQSTDADSPPTEYSAAEFSSMLRTKWEWIGYDIIELDPWLAAIASRSFKSNLPYLVVLDATSQPELRAWLNPLLEQSD